MVTFVERTPADPEAGRLLADYLTERAVSFPRAMGSYRPVRPAADAFDDGVFLVVVDDDGATVGCAGLRRIEAELPTVRYEVKHVYLVPAARGRGLGRALMNELEHRARGLGATETVLDTNRSLEAAGGLYASLGYEPIEPYNDNPNATDWYRKPVA